MKNKFLLVLLLVPFMFLVTACGDDDGDGGDEAPLEAVPEASGDVVTAGSINLNMAGSIKFFDPFGGRSTELVDNPDFEGANTSARVMKWVSGPNGCETWGGAGWRIGNEPGVGPNPAYGTGGPLNFDNMSGTFTLDVWGPAGTIINLRLERLGYPDVDPVQEIAQTKSVAGWETLTFSFVSQDVDGDDNTDTYESIIMYVNKDTPCPTTDETFYIDNLVQGD